jgi:glutamine amidotransferase
MCIIAMIPSKAARPNKAVLENCWESNPDGAGLMYPDATRGILVVDKGHMTLESLLAAFDKAPEKQPVCVHFRIATHGLKDAANTHPHIVWPDEVAMVHNGILPIGAPANSAESDTARFARMVLPMLPKKWWANAALVHLIEEYMGGGNKMVMMDKEGCYKILNEEAGLWDQGVWFSNQGFRASYGYPASVGYYGRGYRRGRAVYELDSDDGGWPTLDQTGTQGCEIVAKAQPAHVATGGGVQPPVAAAAAATTAATAAEVAAAVADGWSSDCEILCTDIGTMTDAEFERYEYLTNMRDLGGIL